MRELNIRVCKECGKTFRTPNNGRLCPSCKEVHRKETQKKEAEKYRGARFIKDDSPQEAEISLSEALRLVRIYNAIHRDKYRSYGEVTHIIENTKIDCCVCCGEVVPEGRMVCPKCEAKAEDAR